MALQIEQVLNFFCCEGYDLEWDNDEQCYLLIREVDNRVVARIWMEYEIYDDEMIAEA